MFVDIYDGGEGFWNIADTDFVECTEYSTATLPVEVIILTYSRRNLDPLIALQLYYERYAKQLRSEVLRVDIKRLIREGNYMYVEKYFGCVKRHINKLDWIGK